MKYLSAVAFVCEDIRSEAGGADTLLSIYPDNMEVPSVPGGFERLAIYGRVNFHVDEAPKKITMQLQTPEKTSPLGEVREETISQAIREAKANGSAASGVVFRMMLRNFQVQKAGRLNIIALIDDAEYYCGQLNIKLAPRT